MRLAVTAAPAFALAFALAGCPASQQVAGDAGSNRDGGPSDDGGASDDAGNVIDGGPACQAIPTCTTTIRYTGAGTNVILRGDFESDGWTVGIPMTRQNGAFEVTIPVRDGQVVLYKLVVDGTWMADPGNPKSSPDGFGGQNSVLRIDCDHCPGRAPLDWRDAILYFVMIDRFADGDPTNNMSLNLERPADYQGGDLKGLTDKIKEGYFTSLGVNAIWITSPFDNADGSGIGTDGHNYSGYHGYWPKDLDKVESRVGTLAELKQMIDVAHEHGIQIIIDYVMNHVHSESPVYQQHNDWFWPNSNGRGGDCICGGGCAWEDAFDRKRCWFTSYLPDFDFRNGDARRWSVGNALTWAKTLGVDGYRLDAVKHIEDEWVTDLRARLDAEVEDRQVFYLVGETFTGDRDLIKYYVRPDTMLDGQFDFPLRAQLLEKIARRQGSMMELSSFIDSNLPYYGNGAVMSTFIGNHDVTRAIHSAEDTPLFGDWGEGGRERAWDNRPVMPGRTAFERIAVAYTVLMTIPGIPLIYYGDEIGLPGAADPDNRHFMQFTGLNADQTFLRERIARLARARAAHPALRRGTRANLGAGPSTLVYRMSAAGDSVLVAINRGDSAAPATGLPAGRYRDLATDTMVTAPLDLPARSGMVLVAP